jgi:arsenite oxidase large subunit
MDGYHKHEKGGEFVTYERLRAMGNNGFQEPAKAYTDGKIVGTKRLFSDGTFNTKDGKAIFKEAVWRGLQAPGKEEQKRKFKFLINNGRANHVWQSAYLDAEEELVMDRWPYPYIQINPEDMAALGLKEGDLVEVYNDAGSTQAMALPASTAKKGEAFMLFGYPSGVQGNVVNNGVNELIIPNYKQTWANIRKIADQPESVKHLSFKSWEFPA